MFETQQDGVGRCSSVALKLALSHYGFTEKCWGREENYTKPTYSCGSLDRNSQDASSSRATHTADLISVVHTCDLRRVPGDKSLLHILGKMSSQGTRAENQVQKVQSQDPRYQTAQPFLKWGFIKKLNNETSPDTRAELGLNKIHTGKS